MQGNFSQFVPSPALSHLMSSLSFYFQCCVFVFVLVVRFFKTCSEFVPSLALSHLISSLSRSVPLIVFGFVLVLCIFRFFYSDMF